MMLCGGVWWRDWWWGEAMAWGLCCSSGGEQRVEVLPKNRNTGDRSRAEKKTRKPVTKLAKDQRHAQGDRRGLKDPAGSSAG
jgi:hypothetical protein